MTLRVVDTSVLRVGYEVAGPTDGLPVILLHGWPDDVRTWDAVLPALHGAGCRTYAPWLRGYGATRFLRGDTYRSGQLVALGQDVVEFAAALDLGRYALVGHDWGSRAAYIASTLNKQRVCACVALSTGYGTNSPGQTLSYRSDPELLVSLADGNAAWRESRARRSARFYPAHLGRVVCGL